MHARRSRVQQPSGRSRETLRPLEQLSDICEPCNSSPTFPISEQKDVKHVLPH